MKGVQACIGQESTFCPAAISTVGLPAASAVAEGALDAEPSKIGIAVRTPRAAEP